MGWGKSRSATNEENSVNILGFRVLPTGVWIRVNRQEKKKIISFLTIFLLPMIPGARIIIRLMTAFSEEPGRLREATNSRVLSASHCSQLE